MMRLVRFVFSFGILVFVTSIERAGSIDLRMNYVFPEDAEESHSICTTRDVQSYSKEYHNCLVDRKNKDDGKDLENLVGRIMESSRVCTESFSRTCRPDLKGFIAVMDQVIYGMKDYCNFYLKYVKKEKDWIKDLRCVVGDLSTATYRSCFKEAFVEVGKSEKKFQQKVENAIPCTNKVHKQCSKAAMTSINRMVRTVLKVDQPKKGEIEDEVRLEQPGKKYIEDEVKQEQPGKEDIEDEVKLEQPRKDDIEDHVKPEQPVDKVIVDEVKLEQPEEVDYAVKLRHSEEQHIEYKVQPEHSEEHIEYEAKPGHSEEHIEYEAKPELPWKWHDYITQPLMIMWRAVKSFFGF